MDMQLIWDGHDLHWHYEGAEDWMLLSPSAQFPDFSQSFDDMAPESLQGCAPPFLTALPEPGMVQIWTGLMARTAKDWSLLVRPPANLAAPGGYSLFEGIVETDEWFGPLFTNLRLTQTHKPVHLRADYPLLQVQPLPREAYAEQTLAATAVVPSMAAMSAEDWDAYQKTIVIPGEDRNRPFGAYAIAARRRRHAACPHAAAQAER
jgi:hypothetical protein